MNETISVGSTQRANHQSASSICGQDYLNLAPKAELHLHLEGSLEPEAILESYHRNRINTPSLTGESLRQTFQCRNFRDFVNAFMFSARSLRTPEDFYIAVIDLGARLKEQNVIYAEITWTPQIHQREDLDCTTILQRMNEAAEQVQQNHGPELFWIPDLIRSAPQKAAQTIAWLRTLDLSESRIVAVGLGGPERGHPASQLRSHFLAAQRMGLPANPHAGEQEGPASIWDTIVHLQPRRLGHGVRALEDPRLVRYLAGSGMAIEVCLSSNIILGVYDSLKQHPIKSLVQQGVCVTLNSDDPGVFQTSLNEEYRKAHLGCGLTIPEIRQIIINGFASSYLPPDRKTDYLRRVIAILDHLDTSLAKRLCVKLHRDNGSEERDIATKE